MRISEDYLADGSALSLLSSVRFREAVKYREVIHAIDNKVPGPKRSGSEQQRWAVVDGQKVTRVTYPKVHASDMKPGTLNSIRKQLHLDRDNFDRFVECPMSGTEYEELLRDLVKQGIL